MRCGARPRRVGSREGAVRIVPTRCYRGTSSLSNGRTARSGRGPGSGVGGNPRAEGRSRSRRGAQIGGSSGPGAGGEPGLGAGYRPVPGIASNESARGDLTPHAAGSITATSARALWAGADVEGSDGRAADGRLDSWGPREPGRGPGLAAAHRGEYNTAGTPTRSSQGPRGSSRRAAFPAGSGSPCPPRGGGRRPRSHRPRDPPPTDPVLERSGPVLAVGSGLHRSTEDLLVRRIRRSRRPDRS